MTAQGQSSCGLGCNHATDEVQKSVQTLPCVFLSDFGQKMLIIMQRTDPPGQCQSPQHVANTAKTECIA